jgi:hypothetical protein
MPLTIADLDKFKTSGFDSNYQTDTRRFYSPWDDAHPVIMAILGEVKTSLVLSMFGWTDVEAATAVDKILKTPTIYSQLTLDSTQYGGKTEHQLLERSAAPKRARSSTARCSSSTASGWSPGRRTGP